MHTLGKLLNFIYTKRGEIAVFSAYLCMIFTFALAYIHPSRSALITVNGLNEANLELLLILVSLPAAAKFLYHSMSQDGRKG